jgi:hypothetical protein
LITGERFNVDGDPNLMMVAMALWMITKTVAL